jgi:hypothetical protein
VHISTTPRHTEKLLKEWADLGIPIPLTVLSAPYRQILPPLEEYLTRREAAIGKGQTLMVVLTKFVGSGWRDAIYHNQTTFFLERSLVRHRNIATVLVPYLYNRPPDPPEGPIVLARRAPLWYNGGVSRPGRGGIARKRSRTHGIRQRLLSGLP